MRHYTDIEREVNGAFGLGSLDIEAYPVFAKLQLGRVVEKTETFDPLYIGKTSVSQEAFEDFEGEAAFVVVVVVDLAAENNPHHMHFLIGVKGRIDEKMGQGFHIRNSHLEYALLFENAADGNKRVN